MQFVDALINFDKFLIGAVNGPAIGEGFSVPLHCDVIFANQSVYFWAPSAGEALRRILQHPIDAKTAGQSLARCDVSWSAHQCS